MEGKTENLMSRTEFDASSGTTQQIITSNLGTASPSYEFHALARIPHACEPIRLLGLIPFLPVHGLLCCARHLHQLVGIAVLVLQSGY